ncbi:hypothetical protein BDV93DRAFT_514884 [Ceratobasidium sp. AG-I]|nr:hypothetical protein BDV93DRAFT_514884 [Ceratobasidium sp. AG-I]
MRRSTDRLSPLRAPKRLAAAPSPLEKRSGQWSRPAPRSWVQDSSAAAVGSVKRTGDCHYGVAKKLPAAASPPSTVRSKLRSSARNGPAVCRSWTRDGGVRIVPRGLSSTTCSEWPGWQTGEGRESKGGAEEEMMPRDPTIQSHEAEFSGMKRLSVHTAWRGGSGIFGLSLGSAHCAEISTLGKSLAKHKRVERRESVAREVKWPLLQEEERRWRTAGLNPLASRAGSAPPTGARFSVLLDGLFFPDSVGSALSLIYLRIPNANTHLCGLSIATCRSARAAARYWQNDPHNIQKMSAKGLIIHGFRFLVNLDLEITAKLEALKCASGDGAVNVKY